MTPLDPPDIKQCQAEVPNGNNPFTLGGSPGLVRCTNAPVVVATEAKPGDDGQIGSMSLCSRCWSQMIKQLGPNHVKVCPVEDYNANA